ncbi:alkaline phosphatase family protein [Candidatus Altiarchaeota archaeon]
MYERTTVVIVLDAFRWDYINKEDSPKLHAFSREGIYVEKLVSSKGFSQRSVLFTGASPKTSGYFTEFAYDPDNSPFRFIRPFKFLLKHLSDGLFARALKKFVIKPIAELKSFHAPSSLIPFEVLDLIALNEDRTPIYASKALNVETMFDVMREEGKSFEYLMFPVVDGDDDYTMQNVLEKLKTGKDLYMFMFSESDFGVHKNGTLSSERRDIVRRIDKRITLLKREFEEHYGQVNLVVLGDHGMTDVGKNVDVKKIVDEKTHGKGLVHGKDYLLFLDSTMARLWFFTEAGESALKDVFECKELMENGKVVDKEFAEKSRIPFADKRYGDVIWWANDGVLIHPDYFHPRNVVYKAMHGYSSDNDDLKGFLVVYGGDLKQKTIKEADLMDTCPTLCSLLGIRSPESNEGRSLLE